MKDQNHDSNFLSAKQKSTSSDINMRFVMGLFFTVSIGTIQFGYMLGSWNSASECYSKKFGWGEEEIHDRLMIVQTLTLLGASTGALFSGKLAYLGRWRCIMIANALLVVGSLITFIESFPMLLVGRFIYGLSSGVFSVYCPKYISEVAPVEINGPAGALTQLAITFGLMLSFLVGLGIGNTKQAAIDSFEVQYYWRIIFLVPVVLSVVQCLLLTFVYKFDTPVFYKKNGDLDKLKQLMNKIYKVEEFAEQRIDEIEVEKNQQAPQETYFALFFDPRYRRATITGCFTAIFTQFTGINVFMFYSNMIFKDMNMSNTSITALMGIVNFLTSFVGLILLAYLGRKAIMFWCFLVMSMIIFTMARFSNNHNQEGEVVCMLFFVAVFEFSSGPITWIYMAEIMRDKALSIGAFICQFGSLAVATAVPMLLKKYTIGQIFNGFGFITVIGTVFIAVFMKETKGKTQAEIDQMFNDAQDDTDAYKKVEDNVELENESTD